ncbi:P-loop containing nucleoside triphosphate hydrolases superfamily protein [Actinidia rufa]|uniref:P-loop containing nucleoside triphosphate hydrolases superfamily protein n=1 Tax=Actinidia rufa TaxID=165716 RepID=A0A7J0DBD7_9ERIC|nr:P-loop containing nucleoside triphosphate hydrolases superfamily protein [Actinidia rufa]
MTTSSTPTDPPPKPPSENSPSPFPTPRRPSSSSPTGPRATIASAPPTCGSAATMTPSRRTRMASKSSPTRGPQVRPVLLVRSCDDASESVASEKWLQNLHDELQKQGITLSESFPDRQWSKYLDEYENPQITVLMDCEVFSPFRFPMQMMRSCAMLLQDHYPNYLGYLIVIRLPPIQGPSLVSSLKDSSLHSSLRQPAFDLIQTILVSDAAVLVTSMLDCHTPPIISKSTSFELNDEDEDEGLCLLMIVKRRMIVVWNEFSVQSRFTSQEFFGEWMSIPMLGHYVFVEIDPLNLSCIVFQGCFLGIISFDYGGT